MQALDSNAVRQDDGDAMAQERRMEFQYRSGDRPLEGYVVKRGLGWGGFGEVYYALSDSGKEVALKLVRRHLDIEIRGVTQCINLKSPNLVTIYDVKENDRGENWIVMEYVAGACLQQRLGQAQGPLDFDEARSWLAGIAAGVDYLHRNGIVHRDLKPGNIFREDEVVKIGDYGLSKFISVSRRSNQTQSVGTVHYMAPEISTGNYGRSVDVYSTAVIAFEMLSGDVPFDGETPGEVLMKHLTAAPDLTKIDPKYRPVFEKALAKAPENRFPAAADLVAAVEAVHYGRPIPVISAAASVGLAAPARTPSPAPAPPARPRDETPNETADPFAETQAGPVQPGPMQWSLPPLPGTFAAKRREVSNLFWQMFLGGLLAAVLPLVLLTVWKTFNGSYEPNLRDYAVLTGMVGLGVAGVLSFGLSWQSGRSESASRHLQMLLFGLAFGLSWMALDLWFYQIEPEVVGGLDADLLFREESLRKLMPYALGYLTLGALAFAIPDWMCVVDRTRRHRVSAGPVIWPALVAFGVASLLLHSSGMAWSAAAVFGSIGLIAQWVSPHETALARRRRTRRQFAGR